MDREEFLPEYERLREITPEAGEDVYKAAKEAQSRLVSKAFDDVRWVKEADGAAAVETACAKAANLIGWIGFGEDLTPSQVSPLFTGENPKKDLDGLRGILMGDLDAGRGQEELDLERAASEAGAKASSLVNVEGLDENAADEARKAAAIKASNAEYMKYAKGLATYRDKFGDKAVEAYQYGKTPTPISDEDLSWASSLTDEEREANEYLRKVAEQDANPAMPKDGAEQLALLADAAERAERIPAAQKALAAKREEILAAKAANEVKSGFARQRLAFYAMALMPDLTDDGRELLKWAFKHPDVNPSRATQFDYRLQKDREKGAGEEDLTLSKVLMLALDNPDASPETRRDAEEWYFLDKFTNLPQKDRQAITPILSGLRGYGNMSDTAGGAAWNAFVRGFTDTAMGAVEGAESFIRRACVNSEDYQRQAEVWADVRNATEENAYSFEDALKKKDGTWGAVRGYVYDSIVSASGSLPYMAIAGTGPAGVVAIALQERQKMEDIVASQGGDVSSPEFMWQSALCAGAYAGVEYIAWDGLAGMFKTPEVARRGQIRLFQRLVAKEFMRDFAKFELTETLEEDIQDEIEQVFTDMKLDKPPEEMIRNAARTLYETTRQTLGSMAVTGAVGMGKRALTTNTRTARALEQDEIVRAMQARREVARMMEEREDRTMDASAVNMDEYERNLGDITLGYLESGGRRGNGLRFLTGLGFNETDAKAMAHTIDTLWQSVNTSLEGDARDEAVRKALGGREQLSPEERIRARIPAAREVKPVKEDGKVVAYDVVMDLKDKDGRPITVKDKDGRDVPWTMRITESRSVPIDWDNDDALHSLFAALRSDPNTKDEWAGKTINDLKLDYTAEQRAALNASLSNPLLARGYTKTDEDNPNVDNMVLGLGYEDFAIAHESLHSFLDALEAAGELTPEERKAVGEAVNADADEEDLADVYEILMSRINPQNVAKRGRIENFLNKLNAWQEGKGLVLDAFRAERKREIDLGNDFFNQIANGNWRGVTWAKRQAPDAAPQRTAEELEEDRLARVEEEDSWNATAEPAPAADEGEAQPSNPEQSVQAQRARDAAQRERENPARREEAERVSAAVAEIDRLLNSFGDDGVADFLSDRRHASAWDALGAARDAGDGNAIGAAAQRLLVMARAYDAARRRKAADQASEQEAIEEAGRERSADAEARANKVQERKGREEENRRRNEERAAVNKWLAKQEDKDRRKIMGDERRKMREERRQRIAALAEEVIDATQDGGMAIETAIDAVAETDYERKRLLDIFAEQIRARDAEREEDARARREEEDSYNYNGEALPVDEEGAVAGGEVETWGVTLPDGTEIGGEVTATDLDGLVLPEGATNPLTNEEMRDLAMVLVEAGPDAMRLNVDYNGVVQSPPWMLDVVRLVYDLGYGDRMREAAARGNWNLGGMTRPVVVERVAGGTDEETKAKVRSAYIDAAMAEIEARRQERERAEEAAAKAAAEAAQQQEQEKQEQKAQPTPKPSVTAKRMDFSYKADDYEKYTGDATGAAFLNLRNERGAIIPLPAGFADYWREYTKWRKAVNNGWQYHGQKAGPENRPHMQAFGVADTALADWCAAFLDGRTFDDAEVRFLFGRGALGAKAVRGGDSGNYLAELASLAPGLAGEVVENGDGSYDVDSFLDAALDAYRKYTEWRQGKATARKEGREMLTAEERHWQEAEEEEEADRRDAIKAWDDAIQRGEAIDMDDIGAAIAQEYDNAVGFVYDERSEDWRPFDGENLSRLRDGDWVQWDGETEAFRFTGYDAGSGVLTITSEETGRTRTFEVTDDAILETTEENDNGNRGQTETRPDDDLAGNEAGEGGAREEGGGAGAEGDFALESATPEQIEAERERARVRAEIERRLNERIEGGTVNIQENFDLGDGGSGDLFEPTTRYSIVGARGADRLGIGTLADAEELENAGADRTAIWRQTGWWRGRDGKWRVELPDITQGEIDKLARHFLHAWAERKARGEKKPAPYASLGGTFGNLAYELHLPSLLRLIRAYPQLADVQFRGNNTETTRNGYYGVTAFRKERDAEGRLVPGYIEIPLGFRSFKSIRGTLVHELQHVIQAYEGFPNGGTSDKGSVDAAASGAIGEGNYRAIPGEVEANTARRRAEMTEGEREAEPPWITERKVELVQNIRGMLTRKDFEKAKGKTREEIFSEFDNTQREIGELPNDLALPPELNVERRVVKGAQAYILNHLVNKPGHERQLSNEDAIRLLRLIDPKNEMRVVPQRGSTSLAFIAANPDGGWDCTVIAPRRGEFFILKTMFAQTKKPYQDKVQIRYSVDAVERNGAVDSLLRGPLASIRDSANNGNIIPQAGENVNGDGQQRYSLVTRAEDAAYMDAVNRGDMDTAQRMVREAAAKAGYSDDASWRMQHQAPTREDVEGGGAICLADVGTEKGDLLPADVLENPQYYFNLDENGAWESLSALRAAVFEERRHREAGDGKHATIVMYRGVDKTKNKHESHFRNGDWITPSRSYALGEARDNPNGGRVIKSRVSVTKVFWTGDSISEFGFDNGKNLAYKDTKNNRKLLDPVTYDDAGNVIPLSERFNPQNADIRYSLARRGDDSLSPRSYGANTYLTAMIATDILRGIDRSDAEYERLAANLHARLPVADARDRAAQAVARDGRRAVREAVPREQMKRLAKGVEAAEMKNHLMDAATGGQRAGVDYGQIAERGAQRAKTNIRRDGAAQSSDYAEFLEHFGVDIAGMLTGRELDGPPADYPQAQKVQLFPVNVALDATTDERARALLAAFKAWRENQEVWLRDAMEKAGGEYLGQAFPIPPELMEKAGLDLNSSGDLAAFLKVAVCAWIAETEGVNASVERILSNPLYARRYAVTMARLLRDLAQKVMDPKNAFAARQVERAIASLEADEVTPESVEKRTAAVIRTVNVNAVRQTRKAIIKDLREQIHALAGVWEDSKIDELEKDENRRVLGHVARMAKFVSEVIGYGAVRTAKEIAKAQKRMEEAAKAVDLSGRTDITAADLESYRRAAQELVALEQYGGLKDKAPAEIQRIGLEIIDWLKNAYAEHEARWDAYTRENDAIQKPFAAGADNAVRRIEALEDFAELNLSSISDRLMLICRGAKGDKADAAQRAIDEINYIINRAVQKRDAVKVKYENDLAAAIYDAVDGTGMSARDFVRHLGEKVDDEISRAITDMGDPAKGRRGQRHFNDGARDSRLTWGQVLYILSYLEQAQSYGRNIKLYGRENQAAYIRSVASSADLKFLRNLQGLMASHRGELSDSLMEITGFSISAPDVFYFPVHTYNGPGEGLDTEISGAFNPLAPYTPRRMHSKDIDESRDILSVYMESALNDAGIIAFGLDGMRLRSILTRKETMEAIYAGAGKYEAEKMRSQLTDIITDGRAIRPTAVDRMMQRLNSFATYTQLGFNFNSSLKQLASIPAWAGVLPDGGRNVVRYIMDFDWAAAHELMDGDGFAARYGRYGWGRGMVAKVLSDPRLSWWDKAKQLSMTPIQFCDFVPGIMVATGLYKAQYEALRDRGLSPAEAKARAQVYAWQKIEESQQSSQQQNMNEVFRRAGVFGRAALKYANAPVLQASHVFTTARLALADPKNARKWGNFAATVAANHILMPCAMYAITSGFRAMLGQEPPEEWRAELITMMLLGSFGRIIMVGGILETGLRAIAGLPQKTGGDIPGFDNARRVEADVLGAMGVTNQFDAEKMGEAWSDLAKDLSPLLRHILTAVENWGE